MRTRTIVLALLSITCVCAPLITADCLCAKVAMYPIPNGGGLWYHYAIVTDSACNDLYATGSIENYTSGEDCGPGCGECSSLPVLHGLPALDLHFEGMRPEYEDINEPDEIKYFLQSHAGSFGSGYDNFNYTLRGVVRLTRTAMGQEQAFYAIVWRFEISQGPAPRPFGFAGIEISQPDGAVPVITIASQCNAVVTSSNGHAPVPGLLQVQFSSANRFDVAYIRLHNSPENLNANYQPCPHPDIRLLRRNGIQTFSSEPNTGRKSNLVASYSPPNFRGCKSRHRCRLLKRIRK